MNKHDLLMEFASGALSPAASLLVSTQARLRPDVRRRLEALEGVGGAMLEAVEAAETGPEALERVLGRLEGAASEAAELGSSASSRASGQAPALEAFFAGDFSKVAWKTLIPGMRYAPIPEFTTPECETRLINLPAGRAIPRHTHKGLELTLVLTGGFEDETGRYDVGDIAIADPSIEHQPKVDPDADCVCLTVVEGGLRIRRPVIEFARYFLQ